MISNYYGSFLNLINFIFILILSPKLVTIFHGSTGAKQST